MANRLRTHAYILYILLIVLFFHPGAVAQKKPAKPVSGKSVAADKEKKAAKLEPGKVPSPSEYLGFEVGAERKLADYKQIADYFKVLREASPRVQIEELGKTTLGADMFMAVISSEENLKNQAKYKEIARRLADPRGLSKEQIDLLVRDGKTILLITCNIHSTEIGSSQMAMEWAYKLATAQDDETKRRLNDVILLLIPSLNPDGETMVTEWYRKYIGTKYEGGAMPYLYHHYSGHDNNRDWYMLTQKETQNVNRAVYHEWYPQFWLDEHQMGSYGPRIYVPPNADPVAKLVNPLIHRGNTLLGATMAWRLEEAGKSGVIYGYSFDAYWPGGTRNTGWWKNMFGVLTEVASTRIATPMDIAPNELNGGSKGLVDYAQQINFPNPWPGGIWRLRDIMDYERIISDATLETASQHREDFLRGVATMANQAVETAKADEYWRIPLDDQYDPIAATRLADLMLQHGVEVRMTHDRRTFLIPTAQPYGRFVEEMMGIQHYPEVKPAPGSGILEPYDVAAWSLPLMMGVKAEKVILPQVERATFVSRQELAWPVGGTDRKSKYYSASPRLNNTSALINAMWKAGVKVYTSVGGDVLFESHNELQAAASRYHVPLAVFTDLPQDAKPLKPVRVGLYKPFVASMDEGWTRFVLEQYGFNLKNIDNTQMKAGNLEKTFDAIILPDVDRDVILDGRPRAGAGEFAGAFEEFPPEYTGGIGREGEKALREFVEKGGTLITLARSSELIGEEFNLPVRNVLARAKDADFNCPGSLLRVYVDNKHPVGYGMPEEAAAFVDKPIAFQTSSPTPDIQRNVLAWYPTDEKDVLLSGWIHGADKLTRKAAAVSFSKGKGKIVMFGFRVQHRAQTEGTFKLLFNAILWAGM